MLFVVLFAAAPAACGGEPAPRADAPIVVIDDAGDTVQLAAPARRVVSLVPAATELLFAIGAGDQVVGRTPYDDWPLEAERVPVVSEGITLNLEGIVAADPDLVVVYPSSANAAAVERLRGLGIAVVQTRTDRIADAMRLTRVYGTLTGHRRAADSVVAALERDLAAATAPAAADPPRLFLLVWDQPPMTVGSESFLTEIMARAGGINVFADLTAPSAPVSIEAVAARQPDWILTSADSTPAFARRPEWQTVEAVRAGRFVSIKGSEFNRPGPRTPAAIRTLRTRLEAKP